VQVNLANNQLCGINRLGVGTYNADGIKAIAKAISVTPSLTSIDLSGNNLRDEGAKVLAPALRDSPSLTSIDLYGNSIGPEGAKALAPAIRDSPR
jgi:Ran GTPase-activating protein (RanGAP) involved in mRNA processing and transport